MNNFSNDMNRYNRLLCEIEAIYHKVALKLDINDSALKILYTICDIGNGCLLNDIRIRSGLSKQTLNSAVRRLEDDALVYLEAADGRSKRVFLTDKGLTLADNTAMKLIDIENGIFASWNTHDVEAYLALTEKFRESLKNAANNL